VIAPSVRPATRGLALPLLCVLLCLLGCGGPAPTSPPSPTPRATGGVLRVGLDFPDYEQFQKNESGTYDGSWDPSTTWAMAPFEVFRCCLLRTLMSYNGRAIADGGAELEPDLADGFPDVSPDGLTWTFHLKEGLTYAPPMGTVPVTSGDFVRALERTLRQDPNANGEETAPFGPYSNYFSDVIVGAAEFTQGAAGISGLETPDPSTLVVHLTRPAGDLGVRLAMPAAAPIPPGAADGHDAGYGRYLVASGPYMIEGADELRPDLPPEQQRAVAGYVAEESLTLVRNPSWDAASDPLRAALADRIELVNVGFDDQYQATVDDEIDVGLNLDLSMPEDLDPVRADPNLAPRLQRTTGQATDWVMLNLATPPFDDVHVRRAIQFAANRQTLLGLVNPGSVVQAHALPDLFTNGLLTDYDPYGVSDHAGDPTRAAAEMALSRYDTDGDGVCDARSCTSIALPIMQERPELRVAAEAFTTQLDGLGLTFEISSVPFEEYWGGVTDATSHTPIAFTVGWTSDYLNAAAWFTPLARSSSIGEDFGLNMSLVGASPDELAEWGYDVSEVPSLDTKIDECVALTGSAQFTCWAEADQYMTERVAAWLPLGTRQVAHLTSSLVTSFEYDDSITMPSLGRIVVSRR